MASPARTAGPGASATPASAARTGDTRAQLHRRRRQREPVVPGAVLAAPRFGQRRGGLRVAPHELHHHQRHVPVRGARAADPAPPQGRRRRQAPGASVRLHAAHQALVHALSPDADSAAPPALVVAAAPYYQAYEGQTTMFDGREYRWGGPSALWANASAGKNFIEFVTSPNNPDAMLRRKPALGGSAAIFDHAYYWPHFTHIPAPADEDVMMFTISKPSGHAGSRLGWALIRDENVAKKALDYVSVSIMGASRDMQLRMLGIVKAMLANLHGEEDIFAFGHDVMRTRWRRLSAVVSRSRRISLQKIPPQYCTYFKRVREPSPAYAWVKCEREEDEDCYGALLKANIITRAGDNYEAGSRYTRISLLKSDDDFDVLMERVTDLVNAEKYDDDAPRSSSM